MVPPEGSRGFAQRASFRSSSLARAVGGVLVERFLVADKWGQHLKGPLQK